MSEVEVIQDNDLLVLSEEDASSIVVTLDDETEIVQTMEQGPPGPRGQEGVQGPQGAPGADGNTVLYGPSDPLDEGVGGDFYINTTTDTIFGPKTANAWPAGTSLVGAPGPQGIQGPHGAQGPQGIPGTPGAAGAAGNTVLYGATDPVAATGVNGNFYINTTTHFMFGPKAAGAWPAGTSLIGPQGPQGVKGDQGPQGVPGVGLTVTGLAAGTDFNAVVTTGAYITAFLDSTNTPSSPTQNYWYLWVTVSINADYVHQRASLYLGSSPQTWERRKVNAVWEAWQLVLSTAPLTLTAAQQAQARKNIFAAPFDAMAYNGLQLNGGQSVSQDKVSSLISLFGAASSLTDGWMVVVTGAATISAQQVNNCPVGFTHSLRIAVTTAAPSLGASDLCIIDHKIEGFTAARLGFGTASASPVSLAFWVKAHRPGLYSGSLRNAANNRSCVFSYTINSADTWEYKTATLPGETTGTWVSDNGVGLEVSFAIAIGATYQGAAGAWSGANLIGVNGTTNGVTATTDTFQITGFVLLPGIELPSASASPLILRPFPHELELCRRHYEKSYNYADRPGTATQLGMVEMYVSAGIGSYQTPGFRYKQKRVTPTLTFFSANSGAAGVAYAVLANADKAATPEGAGENGSNAFFALGAADLVRYHWVADARM